MTNNLLKAKLRLEDAAEHMLIAHYTDREFHIELAQKYLALALVPDAPYGEEMAWLLDVIATAITDSHDIDSTDEDAARFVIDALFKHITLRDSKSSEAA